MKETAKALLRKNQNEPSAARALYVSLDRADNVIEGGPAFEVEVGVPRPWRFSRAGLLTLLSDLGGWQSL
jgi:hypothetical protein